MIVIVVLATLVVIVALIGIRLVVVASSVVDRNCLAHCNKISVRLSCMSLSTLNSQLSTLLFINNVSPA